MSTNPRQVPPVSTLIILVLIILNAIVLQAGLQPGSDAYWWLLLTLPLFIIAAINVKQRRNALLRHYPLLGYLCPLLKMIHPQMCEHFLASDPDAVVRLNSSVTIKDLSKGNEITLSIVLPEFADVKQKKISVLAPMAKALIGFKRGQTIIRHLPAGEKHFLILDVRS